MKSRASIKAMAQDLRAQGVNVELLENAVPRMYYRNQIAQHIKGSKEGSDFIYQANPEVCDFVLRVPDAYYDVGFLKHKDGHYVPVFDDYDYSSCYVPESQNGSGPIRDYLGAEFAGSVQHWSGRKSANDQTLHSVGKMLQAYTKAATIEAAVNSGYTVSGVSNGQNGEIHIHVTVN